MLERFEQFTTLVCAIYRDIQKIERDEMEKRGLRGAYAQYFLALMHSPQGLTVAGLSEACEKDKAAVSRAVSALESKGYVIRDAGNAYRAILTLTQRGREAAQFVARRAALAVEQAGKGLTDDDRRIFYAALSRIQTNLNLVAQKGIQDFV